jgi:hypothetical protein
MWRLRRECACRKCELCLTKTESVNEEILAISNRVSGSDAHRRACRWRSLCAKNVVSRKYNYRKTGEKPTIVCDVILPMGQLPTKGVPEVLEREAHSKSLGYVRDDTIFEECPCFRLGAVTDCDNLKCHPT